VSTLTLVSGADGQPVYFEGTVQDITLEHLNYLNLQASESTVQISHRAVV
jgi:hypothetical protein